MFPNAYFRIVKNQNYAYFRIVQNCDYAYFRKATANPYAKFASQKAKKTPGEKVEIVSKKVWTLSPFCDIVVC